MSKYALVDLDGYICKAFYAAKARGNSDDAGEILYRLISSAQSKCNDYFGGDAIFKMIYFVSGHTWKKDKFDTYKKHRTKDVELTRFRDYVIDSMEAVKSNELEADDLINLCVEYIEQTERDSYIVFSDDKDLHAIAKTYCKINLQEEVKINPMLKDLMYIQMLMGDKEDDVKGIPKVGCKTAEKLLDGEYTIDKVCRVYKDKGVSFEEAYKNILLIKPLSIDLNKYPLSGAYVANRILQEEFVDEDIIVDCINGEREFILEELLKTYKTKGVNDTNESYKRTTEEK